MRIIKITQDRGERKSSLPNVGVKSNWKQEYINQYGEHFNDKLIGSIVTGILQLCRLQQLS